MTVCVAAMSQNVVIGASDRLLTWGDIKYEPTQSKTWRLTEGMAVMVAGDAILNHEILVRVTSSVTDTTTVEEAANLYRACYQDVFLTRVENSILAPFNLDRNSFLTHQQYLTADLANKLSTDIMNFEPTTEGVEAIFAGRDKTGPHLYLVKGSDVKCYDSIGFVAIGMGAWHAQSEMTFVRHTVSRPVPEMTLDVFFAKKRGESAPHVGQSTDMFLIGLRPDSGPFFQRLPLEFLVRLEEIYRATKEHEHQARLKAHGEMLVYLKEMDADIARQQEALTKQIAEQEAPTTPAVKSQQKRVRIRRKRSEG